MGSTSDQFADFTATTLAGGAGGAGTSLLATDTTLLLPTGVGNARYPSTANGPFWMTLGVPANGAAAAEIVKCTARAGDTCTIVRSQGGTNQTWPLNSPVQVSLTSANLSNLWARIQATPINATDYGAKGDGVTDNHAALQAALDAARLAGGGTVLLPPGTFLTSTAAQPNSPATFVGLWVGSGTTIQGAGVGATIIKLAASQPNQCWLMSNYQIAGGTNTDVNICVRDLTFDGNAGGQAGTVDAQFGFRLAGARDCAIINCEARHCYGTTAGTNGPNGTDGEAFGFDAIGCSHITFLGCRAYSDGVLATSGGFSNNRSNDVSYVNCTAHNQKSGQGFTAWQSANVRYANCHAANCGADGFHSEYVDGVEYTNCTSGGATTQYAGTNPYAASTSLGHTGHGFNFFQTIRGTAVNCISQKNGGSGLWVGSAQGPIQVIGGSFTGNTSFGINLSDAASNTQCEVFNNPDLSGNTAGALNYNGNVTTLTGRINPNIAVAGSGVVTTNPYPVRMTVYIAGGTVSAIALDGTATGLTSGTFSVRKGGTITLTYTGAPTWNWFPY